MNESFCGHPKVTRRPVANADGTVSDAWHCFDCEKQFFPEPRSGELNWLRDRVGELSQNPWPVLRERDELRQEVASLTYKYNHLQRAVKSLIDLLAIEETSDEGRPFHPNRITSCRATDSERLNTALKALTNHVKE